MNNKITIPDDLMLDNCTTCGRPQNWHHTPNNRLTACQFKPADRHKWVGGYRLGDPRIAQDKYRVIADCGYECRGYETRIKGDDTTLCPDCVPLLTGGLAGREAR